MRKAKETQVTQPPHSYALLMGVIVIRLQLWIPLGYHV